MFKFIIKLDGILDSNLAKIIKYLKKLKNFTLNYKKSNQLIIVIF